MVVRLLTLILKTIRDNYKSRSNTPMSIVQAAMVDLENSKNTLGDELFNEYVKCSNQSSICYFSCIEHVLTLLTQLK